MEKQNVEQLLNDIREFRDDFKKKGNSYYERLSNKDILFFFLNEIRSLDRRVTKVETRQKVFMWIVPVLIGILGVVGGVVFG